MFAKPSHSILPRERARDSLEITQILLFRGFSEGQKALVQGSLGLSFPTSSARNTPHFMSQTSIELEVRHETSRKQVADEFVLPVLSASDSVGKDTSETFTQTRKQVVRARIQFAALCYTLFLAGWNDGTLGPLLPRIQEVYHVCMSFYTRGKTGVLTDLKVGFAVVSLLFVLACVVR